MKSDQMQLEMTPYAENYENDTYTTETDVENEEEIAVDFIDKIADAVLWSTDWTIESIVSTQKRNAFNINPGFQRRDAWNNVKKSRLIESLVYGLPVPQIVLAEDEKNRGHYLVVDGKQRLLTIFKFFSDDPTIRFKLEGLNSGELNGLDKESLNQQKPELYNNLLTQSIRSIIIRNWKNEDLLYTIFYRLNSGSLPLSPQELRKALKPGPFLELIDVFCSQSKVMKYLLKTKVPDPRMRDMDLLLRYFVMTKHITEYKGNYKEALDRICDIYNKHWDTYEKEVHSILNEFDQVIARAFDIFGENEAFRRLSKNRSESRVNRALFDVITFYFRQIPPTVLPTFTEQIKISTLDLCETDERFKKAISSNTNNLKETATRFVIYGKKIQEIVGLSINIPSNLERHFTKI